jgi:putative membrane protein
MREDLPGPRRGIEGEVVGLSQPGPPLLLRLAISWLTNALVLGLVALLLPGVNVSDAGSLLAAAAVFGVLNTILKPLLRFITLPLALLTLGIAWFFVSLLMLAITDSIVGGFHIDGFWTLVGATVFVWLVNMLLDMTPGPWQVTGRRRRIRRVRIETDRSRW